VWKCFFLLRRVNKRILLIHRNRCDHFLLVCYTVLTSRTKSFLKNGEKSTRYPLIETCVFIAVLKSHELRPWRERGWIWRRILRTLTPCSRYVWEGGGASGYRYAIKKIKNYRLGTVDRSENLHLTNNTFLQNLQPIPWYNILCIMYRTRCKLIR